MLKNNPQKINKHGFMKVVFQTSEEKMDSQTNGARTAAEPCGKDKALSLHYSLHKTKWFTWFKDRDAKRKKKERTMKILGKSSFLLKNSYGIRFLKHDVKLRCHNGKRLNLEHKNLCIMNIYQVKKHIKTIFLL